MDVQKKYLSFLQSSLTEENPFIKTSEVLLWLKNRNNSIKVSVNHISFSKMKCWRFINNFESLVHESGKFFSIIGLNVETNYGNVSSWDQPIINQPEIGYLGFITKEFQGILYFLLQAKIEPGNVNNVQLSPTLQATRSNYTQVHKGKLPEYIEYFKQRSRCSILLDQLQSEQGARFYKKRNRNIIINTNEDIPDNENFIWLTLGQIKKLISIDNIINMDTRTVIAGIPYGSFDENTVSFFDTIGNKNKNDFSKGMLASALSKDSSIHTFDDILAWFTQIKCKYDLNVKQIPLSNCKDWVISDNEIFHRDRKYFRVIATNVEISNREVSSWMQPLVEPAQEGIIAFIVKRFNGIYHFLVQAKVECGNFDTVEMAPTVQCLTGNYKTTPKGELPFLDFILNVQKEQIRLDVMQSEEGGRFYREQNRNIIVEVEGNFEIENFPNFIWISLNQLHTFLNFNNFLNIQARSLISAISFV